MKILPNYKQRRQNGVAAIVLVIFVVAVLIVASVMVYQVHRLAKRLDGKSIPNQQGWGTNDEVMIPALILGGTNNVELVRLDVKDVFVEEWNFDDEPESLFGFEQETQVTGVFPEPEYPVVILTITNANPLAIVLSITSTKKGNWSSVPLSSLTPTDIDGIPVEWYSASINGTPVALERSVDGVSWQTIITVSVPDSPKETPFVDKYAPRNVPLFYRARQ